MKQYTPHHPMPMDSEDTVSDKRDDLSAEQWFDKGVSKQSDGREAEALACYQHALGLSPQMAEACYNMGVIYFGQKAWTKSMVQFKNALILRPDFVDAAFNLANALKENGNHDKAIPIYQQTLAQAPQLSVAHYYKGICHLNTGDPHGATQAMGRAVSIEPKNARYWFHLAEAYLMANAVDSAVACYEKAIELRPDWASAHYNLTVALRVAERIEDAIHHAKEVVRIDPDFVQVLPLLFRLAQHACDWQLVEWSSKHIDEITRKELSRAVKTTEPPLTSIRRCCDVTANLESARSWSKHYADYAGQLAPRLVDDPKISVTGGRLRVGYLSGDFKDHAVAYQIRGLLEKHDRNQFEIYGYACNAEDGSPYRRRMVAACDHFKEVHARSNISVAQQIRDDGIHILVDMAGHSKGNRLGICALRPAPVQVNYLGFLSTTGADFIDYVLADPIVVPPEHAVYYTEKLAYLPHCYQANDDLMPVDEPNQHRRDWHLPQDAFVFGNFNQPYKIDAALFQSWMNILTRVNNSVLWLVERSGPARKNLYRAAEQANIDPKRLIFTGFVPMRQNLARLKLSDLVLDTLIYNGGATTSNALWAGVPVLTVLGNHWVSRMSASALTAIDLPEMIAADLQAYEKMAVDLAHNPTMLESLRQRLQSNRSTAPLFNTSQFTRHVECAFDHMWNRRCTGLPPASFHVAP